MEIAVCWERGRLVRREREEREEGLQDHATSSDSVRSLARFRELGGRAVRAPSKA
ncbi:MAG: hypothetical protein ACR2GW_07455 [Pyrinomonadaceae bacterium]|nr:hypothetical protein [Pyrinomonadaceae bacterium]MDQ3584603.1 hypothetical protein [Acidobacteriota bacterium]